MWFQLIGGLGDIAAGIAAFVALKRLRKNPDKVSRAVIEGNIIGLLDFAIVLSLGVTIVLAALPADQIAMFNLLPLVVVPVFILLHIFSLQKLVVSRKQKEALP